MKPYNVIPFFMVVLLSNTPIPMARANSNGWCPGNDPETRTWCRSVDFAYGDTCEYETRKTVVHIAFSREDVDELMYQLKTLNHNYVTTTPRHPDKRGWWSSLEDVRSGIWPEYRNIDDLLRDWFFVLIDPAARPDLFSFQFEKPSRSWADELRVPIKCTDVQGQPLSFEPNKSSPKGRDWKYCSMTYRLTAIRKPKGLSDLSRIKIVPYDVFTGGPANVVVIRWDQE